MNHTMMIAFCILVLHAVLHHAPAATYQVGSGKPYAGLDDVTGLVNPGDTITVDGNATYSSGTQLSTSGTAEKWIVIRGLQPDGGSRPRISGNTMYGIEISADYIIIEGFEVRGRPKGIGVFGNNIIVRGCIIDSCNHGLIGYGTGTGNVTVEYCEFYGNGVPTGGATQHQIYMATDEELHPNSVFRLQFCYLHDGVEGDNVKSRSERNEIYYNWIENAGSSGHGLGLFAPDPEDNEDVSIETAREDADIVGNVIIQNRNACARIGGDQEGYPTNGRYRFVNNTFILTGTRGDAIRTFNTIETVELYNNVIFSTTSECDLRVINDADGAWLHSPRSITGNKNWITFNATMLPSATECPNTIRREDSPFLNSDEKNLLPDPNSLLINTGSSETPTFTEYPFIAPLFPPAYHPPKSMLINVGTAQPRPENNVIDIGAYEHGSVGVTRLSPNWRVVSGNGAAASQRAVSQRIYRLDGRVVGAMEQRGSSIRLTGQISGKGASSRKVLFLYR